MPNKLSNLEIDEISLVKKGANQHAKVTIAKSADGEEESMDDDLYDSEGNLVDTDDLEVGDQVQDAEGNVYEVDEDTEEYDEGDDEVGKAGALVLRRSPKGAWTGRGRNVFTAGRKGNTSGKWENRKPGSRVGAMFGEARYQGGQAAGRARNAMRQAPGAIAGGARTVANSPYARYGAAVAGGGAAGGTGYALVDHHRKRSNVGKSFSEGMREELSKALTDDDRDAVISKAFDQMEAFAEQAALAEEIAKSERDAREFTECVEIAKSYELPIEAEELAEVIKNCAEYLSEHDNEVIAKCLAFASDANSYLAEQGAEGGGYNTGIMAQLDAVAEQHVAKNQGESVADFYTDIMEQNPEYYDEYLAEQGR